MKDVLNNAAKGIIKLILLLQFRIPLYCQVTDKEEITKLAFYSQVKGKEPIAVIDEKLLDYYAE